MFCPNCGRDCGETKFCSACGQDLRINATEYIFEDREEQLRVEGRTYCPKCLSTSYTVNKEKRRSIYYLSPLVSILEFINFCMSLRTERMYGIQCTCLQCGNSWFPKIKTLHDRYKKHISEPLMGYDAIKFITEDDTYLLLEETQLTICRPQKRDYVVPFTKIIAVDHQESVGELGGRLTIRDNANKYRSFPKTLGKAKKDRLTVFYNSCYSNAYGQLYSALAAIVEENRKAGLL